MEIPTTGQDCLLRAEPCTQLKQSFQSPATFLVTIPAEFICPSCTRQSSTDLGYLSAVKLWQSLQVPVIIDQNQGDKWVNDSWAIAKYLEDTYSHRDALFEGPSGMSSVCAVENWRNGRHVPKCCGTDRVLQDWCISSFAMGPKLMHVLPCAGSGEATASFLQNWFTGEPLDALMKIVILDEYKAQSADLQPWFKETREELYGPLEEVCPQNLYNALFGQRLYPVACQS